MPGDTLGGGQQRGVGRALCGLLALVLLGGAAACGSDGFGPPDPTPGWQGMASPVRILAGVQTLHAALVAADIDGDGRMDVLAVGTSAVEHFSGALLFPGRGDGTLGAPLRLAAGNDARRLAVADLDRNGRPDLLVIGHFDNGFRVFLGRAGGDFAPPAFYGLENHGRHLALGDFDGDGYRDVVALHDGSGQPIGLRAQRPEHRRAAQSG